MIKTLKKSVPDKDLDFFDNNDRIASHYYSETTEVINNLWKNIYSNFGRLLKISDYQKISNLLPTPDSYGEWDFEYFKKELDNIYNQYIPRDEDGNVYNATNTPGQADSDISKLFPYYNEFINSENK
jgi:hypothetical protein